MRNRFFYIVALLIAFASTEVKAQTFIERTFFEVSTATGLRNNGMTPIDFSFKCHVDIVPIFYLFITAEDNLSLYKSREIKTYTNGVSLGGGLGIKLLNRVKSIHSLDLRAKSLDNLGKPDWERTTYDVSLAWYIKSNKFSPIVELGYRFIDSHTDKYNNYGNAYISIGLRY